MAMLGFGGQNSLAGRGFGRLGGLSLVLLFRTATEPFRPGLPVRSLLEFMAEERLERDAAGSSSLFVPEKQKRKSMKTCLELYLRASVMAFYLDDTTLHTMYYDYVLGKSSSCGQPHFVTAP
jgi:hypothetical protein